MRLNITILLLLTILSLQSFGQITQINVEVNPNRHTYKEPKRGFKIYTLIYKKSENGGLILDKIQTQFSRSEKIKISKPKNPESINPNNVEKLNNWISSNKKSFTPWDLNLDSADIENSTQNNVFKCDPDYGQLSSIRIDSFRFCNQYPLRFGAAIGNDTFEITLLERSDTLLSFHFRTDDLIRNKIDLKGYLTLQPCFSIPEGFEVENIFSKKHLLDVVSYYRRMEQCEGYYYYLFTEEHPERTPQENRMQVDWCFKEYLIEKK